MKTFIVKKISWNELLTLFNNGNTGIGNLGNCNTGNYNKGDCNKGDCNLGNGNLGNYNTGTGNLGNYNSGYYNTGDYNTGTGNSGKWNSCDYESGFFNSIQSNEIRVFNKICKREIWDSAIKPSLIYNLVLNEWVPFDNMSDKEKKKYPNAYTCNGYLKEYTYKEAWSNSFNKASKKDIELLKALPNFDADIFEEITGIKIN